MSCIFVLLNGPGRASFIPLSKMRSGFLRHAPRAGLLHPNLAGLLHPNLRCSSTIVGNLNVAAVMMSHRGTGLPQLRMFSSAHGSGRPTDTHNPQGPKSAVKAASAGLPDFIEHWNRDSFRKVHCSLSHSLLGNRLTVHAAVLGWLRPYRNVCYSRWRPGLHSARIAFGPTGNDCAHCGVRPGASAAASTPDRR